MQTELKQRISGGYCLLKADALYHNLFLNLLEVSASVSEKEMMSTL